MKFEIQGSFRAAEGINKAWQPFVKVIESENEKNAREKIYSLIGSKHGIKRNLIKIDGVKSLE